MEVKLVWYGNRVKSADSRFLRRTTNYKLVILEELTIQSVEENLSTYRDTWLKHVARMDYTRIQRGMLNYYPRRKSRQGRSLKRLLDH